MDDKYYVFFYDDDTFELQEISFESEGELHAWIMGQYPDLAAFEESEIRIIYGHKIKIEIEEVEVIKRVKTSRPYTTTT